jgi:hypothetical protein
MCDGVLIFAVGRKRRSRQLRGKRIQPYGTRGLGVRQWGASAEDNETAKPEKGASAPRPGTVENEVLNSLAAASSRESYGPAIDEFIGRYR